MAYVATRLPFFRISRVRLATRPILPLVQRWHAHSFLPRSSSITSSGITGWRNSSSSVPPPSASSETLPENATLSQRLKFLIKRYGWYALGIYMALSTVEFGLTFAAINYLGAEYAGRIEKSLKEYLPSFLHFKQESQDNIERASDFDEAHTSLYTMLVLSYGIHKTLWLPFRIGLTAAITPKFVGWLASRGWIGRQGAKRAAQEMRQRLRRDSPHP